MSPEQEKLKTAMEKLFTAKWNIPQAVAFLDRRSCKEEWDTMKEEFRAYCSENQATHEG